MNTARFRFLSSLSLGAILVLGRAWAGHPGQDRRPNPGSSAVDPDDTPGFKVIVRRVWGEGEIPASQFGGAAVRIVAPAPEAARDQPIVAAEPAGPVNPSAVADRALVASAGPRLTDFGVLHTAEKRAPATLASEPTFTVPKVPESLPAESRPADAAAHPVHDEGSPVSAHKEQDPLWKHRTGVFGEYMYLAPRVDVPYVVGVSGGALSAPLTPVGVVESSYEHTYRAGFTVAFADCFSFEASFSQLNNHNTDFRRVPDDTVIQSLVTHPSTATFEGLGLEANASLDVDFKLAVLDFSYLLYGCDRLALNGQLGVSHGYLNQEFFSRFDILGTTTVATDVKFSGVGPRLGADGEGFLRWGFALYGRGAGSLLLGLPRADYLQENIFVLKQAETSITDDRVVPLLELEAGVRWTAPGGHVRLKAGYYLNSWMNAMTTNDWIQAVQNNNFNRRGGNLSDTIWFDGFLAGAEVRY